MSMHLWGATTARSLSRRFKACFYLSALNLCAMALPALQAPYHWVALIAGIAVNVAACWLILRNVEAARHPRTHERLAAFGIRGIWCLGPLGVVLLSVLGLTHRLSAQSGLFMVIGFGYYAIAASVLGRSTDNLFARIFATRSYRFDDGSSIKVIDRETLRYQENGLETLIWIDAEPGFFKGGRVIKASSIERGTRLSDGTSTDIDAEQRREIVEKALQYFRDHDAKVRVEE
jgi:hypothetical protein